jgi:hypothetical protein
VLLQCLSNGALHRQELYNEREREIKICFDKFGLNQYTSGGGLPDAARLDSSAAVQ